MLISIEGPDFVGKNTIIEKILSYNKGKPIKVISFPNNETEIGRICRRMLKNTEDWTKSEASIFQLLNTAHRYEYYDRIKQAKNNNDEILFVIRYNLSGPVYASIDGIDATKTWQLYDWFHDALPDITFILFRKYDFKHFQQVREAEHYETELMQKRVLDIYKLAPTLWGEKLGTTHIIENSDIEKTVEEIFSKIKMNSK
ncbi:MAG: dTMP kinase [Candidatus Hodarchaeales archaeon]|jgi:thymidylate kinase